MLAKRIIPCLDIKDGRTVKGTNFINLRDAGDPVELAAMYATQGADELVFLDITATIEKRKTLAELVKTNITCDKYSIYSRWWNKDCSGCKYSITMRSRQDLY